MKVKVGHLGTIVAYLEAIRITRVSGSGWADFCEYLTGPLLTFLAVETLLVSANLRCAIFFLDLCDPCFEVFFLICVNDAVFGRDLTFSYFSLIKYLISISVSLSMYAFLVFFLGV